jgi:hypothetical protein
MRQTLLWDSERWDANQAEVYVTEIRAATERITADPSRGRTCDEIRQGYRRYSTGSHLIFYVDFSTSTEPPAWTSSASCTSGWIRRDTSERRRRMRTGVWCDVRHRRDRIEGWGLSACSPSSLFSFEPK